MRHVSPLLPSLLEIEPMYEAYLNNGSLRRLYSINLINPWMEDYMVTVSVMAYEDIVPWSRSREVTER
jgi:hypothetical protein